MEQLTNKEMLKFIDYDHDQVVTYLMMQSGLYKVDSEEYKTETINQLESALKFISETRNHQWTLVLVKEEGRDVSDIQNIAGEFFS